MYAVSSSVVSISRVLRTLLVGALLPVVASAQNLVSYWPADGDAKDFVNSNHGALLNGATFAAGKIRQAFSLDGVNDVVRTGRSSTLNGITKEVTIHAWIKQTGNSTRQTTANAAIVAKKTKTCAQFCLYIGSYLGNDNDLSFFFRSSCAIGQGPIHQYAAPKAITLNQWHHVAARYVSGNAASMMLFVDGLEVKGKWSMGNGQAAMVSSLSDVTIGADELWDGTPARFFKGLIDEVEIHSRALSAAEIRALTRPRPALRTDVSTLSLSTGGSQIMLLDPGTAHANRLYWMLGSITGTTPGIKLLGVQIPLNPDIYTDLLFGIGNSKEFTNFKGTLDATGKATASLNVPKGLPPIPFSLFHGYLVYNATTGQLYTASNAVPVRLQ